MNTDKCICIQIICYFCAFAITDIDIMIFTNHNAQQRLGRTKTRKGRRRAVKAIISHQK